MISYRKMFVLYTILLCGLVSVDGNNKPETELELVATFDHQVTGVSVHPASGRIFVNFPRWTEDSPVSVAEVLSLNETQPYPPKSDWNSWRNTQKNQLDPAKYFICVQSIVVFQDNLYVVDPAAPAVGPVVPGGAKLVEIDLIKDKVKRIILFDENIAPHGSYLNDVRFSPDGKFAYMTDSGAIGAIIVVDMKKGKARRVLHGHAATQTDKKVTVKYNGRPLRRPDGRGVEFSSDGIALSIDGSTLYWQAVQGKTLYSIPTPYLQTSHFDIRLSFNIKTIGKNGPADGLWISPREPNLLYVTSIQDDSIKIRDLSTNTYKVYLTDPRLRWPDTFSEDGQGYIYVTTSHIQDSAMFNETAPKQISTELWRFKSYTATDTVVVPLRDREEF